MAVDDPSSVDVIGVNRASGEVVLTIADHLDWTDVGEHLLHLQAKLNTYLAFVESGEILTSYPSAKGRAVRFEVVARYPLHAEGFAFMERARTIVEGAGFRLGHRVLDEA